MNSKQQRKAVVAAVQVGPAADADANLKRCVELIGVAAGQGAGLICFPELAHAPWVPSKIDKSGFDYAEPLDGGAIQTVCNAAAEHGTGIVFPFFEKYGDRYFNSAAVIDSAGEVLGVYRKVHVPQIPGWEEKYYFEPGDVGFPVFEIAGLKIGIQICWDNFFPEGTRALALAGAQLIVAPTSNAGESHDLWLRALSANAMFNGVFSLRVNRVGGGDGQNFYGRSFMVDPYGDLADQEAGEAEGLMLSDVYPEALVVIRREFPFLADRRPDYYGALCESGPTEANQQAGEDNDDS